MVGWEHRHIQVVDSKTPEGGMWPLIRQPYTGRAGLGKERLTESSANPTNLGNGPKLKLGVSWNVHIRITVFTKCVNYSYGLFFKLVILTLIIETQFAILSPHVFYSHCLLLICIHFSNCIPNLLLITHQMVKSESSDVCWKYNGAPYITLNL